MEQAISACQNLLIRFENDDSASQLLDVNAVLPIVTCATTALGVVTDSDRLNRWLNVRLLLKVAF